MTVSHTTIIAEVLSDSFKNLGKKRVYFFKKDGKNVLKDPERTVDITTKVASAVASRNPKAALSTLTEVIKFYHTEKSFALGNLFDFMPSEWNK